MSSSKPLLFSSLIGNDKAKEILRRLISQETLPTTLLFHGPSGVGKSHFAHEVARALLGSDKKEHPDLHELFPDPKSDQHLVANLRALLEETELLPFEAPFKIFIIHDAEKMLPTSSNTLLKTLEEPPPRTYFLLLTSQITLILPTLLSRCCKIAFYPIPEPEIARYLAEHHLTPDGKKIALLSEGSLAEAIRRATQTSHFPISKLLHAKTYQELYDLLQFLPDDLSSQETDELFEEILFAIREEDPLQLESALPRIAKARDALRHHVKLKTVLEQFFLGN